MAQYLFGTGQVHSMPVGGGAPLRLGTLQDVAVNFSGDVKQLFGQFQFPVAVARGKTKIDGKAATGELNLDTYNNLFFGQTTATGEKKQVFNEAASIPATPGPYTVTAANGATFFIDLGVYFAATGQRLEQVAAAPAAGQYSVDNAGVYTFAAADQGLGVLLNYIYDSTTTGKSMTISNQLMGSTPYFQLVLSQEFDGKFFTLILYKVVSEKLSMPLKQDDFLISDIDFQAQANDAGNIAYLSVTG